MAHLKRESDALLGIPSFSSYKNFAIVILDIIYTPMRTGRIVEEAKKGMSALLSEEAARVSHVDTTNATAKDIDAALASIESFELLQLDLEQWVHDTCETADVHSAADVDALCSQIDLKINEMQAQLLALYDQSPAGGDAQTSWKNFLKKLDTLRADARRELLSELTNIETSTKSDATPKHDLATDKGRIQELEQDVEDALEMLEEAEDEKRQALVRIKSLEEEVLRLKRDRTLSPSTVEVSSEETVETTLTKKRTTLLEIDEQLEEREEAIDTAYTDIAQLLQTLKRKKEYELPELLERAEAKERLGVAGAAGERHGLEAEQTLLNHQVVDIERRLLLIQQSSDAIKERRRYITRYLEAISLVQLPIDSTIPDITQTLQFAELPEIISEQDHVATDDTHIPVPTIPAQAERHRSTEQTGEIHDVAGLPYSVEFTDLDRAVARDVEDMVAELQSLSGLELRKRLTYLATTDVGDEQLQLRHDNVDEMIKDLAAGVFLDKIKLATVILGSMRKGNAFSGRVGAGVNSKIRIKEVGLATSMSDAAEVASRVFNRMELLGEMVPQLQLIRKVIVGSAYGKATELTTKGEIVSAVWTDELIRAGRITKDQLAALYKSVNK